MHPRKHLFVLLTLLAVLAGGAAQAATDLVSSTLDNGTAGTLRVVIANANPGDTIIFSNSLSGATITLNSGQIALNKNLAIDASSLTNGIILNGNHICRIFEVDSGTIVLNSLTITNGNDTGANAGGGGILNYTTLTLNNCTLVGNSANQSAWGGGGILNYGGTLTLNQCTLSGNAANNNTSGGGIISYNPCIVTVNQSTLSGNSAPAGGAGIFSFGSTVIISNSIVAGNSPDDLGGSAATLTGVNLIGGTPLLTPLGYYGGPTPTMPPLLGSPAVDGCTNGSSFTKDQRGFPRPSGAAADIGSVELQFTPVVITAADTGFGSLRYAIANATNGSLITFTNTLSGATIALTGGQLVLNKNLIIDATGLSSPITISGNNASRVFQILPGTTNVLTALVIKNGHVVGSGNTSGQGGAINNFGTLVLNRDTITANVAVGGAGPGFTGTNGSTGGTGQSITGGNAGAGQGGGIYNSGILTLNQDTVSSNSATGGVGGTGAGGSGGNGLSSGGTSGGDAGPGGNGTGGLGGDGLGGGIYNTGTLILNQDTIAGNTVTGGAGGHGTGGNGGIGGVGSIADGKGGNGANGIGGKGGNSEGAGIFNSTGTLLVNQDTLAVNSGSVGGAGTGTAGTGGHGGVIAGNGSNGSATAGSTGTSTGGGLFVTSGTVALTNTLVAANTASNTLNNITGTYTGTNNLLTTAAAIGPLGNNGGPTPTIPLLVGSPALDACTNGTSFTFDQRGYPRGRDGTGIGNLRSDIGAVEMQTPPLNGPEDLVITTTADELDPPGVFGAGMSLREAVRDVAVGRNINFDSALTGQTITLTNGEVLVTKSLTVNAFSLPGGMTISGNHNSRIFSFTNNITVTLANLTLTNGNGVGAALSAFGGAILNFGNLTLNSCRLTGNQADGVAGGGGALATIDGSLIMNQTTVNGNVSDYCSGILIQDQPAAINACTISGNSGVNGVAVLLQSGGGLPTLTMINSTVSGNTSTNSTGSALWIWSDAGELVTAALTNCTLTGNITTLAGQPGAVYVTPGGSNILSLYNTIVSGNTAGGVPADITGNATASSAFNLIGSGGGLANGVNGNLTGINNPQLAALGNNGGPTQTQPPLFASPAVDGGTVTSIATDQRGLPRLAGSSSDIGAVELQFSPVVQTNSDNGPGSLRYTVNFATNGTTINFTNTLAGSTITLTHGEFLLNKSLTIDGSSLSANGGIALNGNHTNRLFEIGNGATVNFKSLVLSNGFASGASGGAIYNNSVCTGTVQNCYVVNCSADIYGGGILNNGTLTLLNSTVAGNHAAQFGGAINNDGTLFVNQGTLAANSAGNGGGAISSGGQVTVTQSTITTNTAGAFAGGIHSGGSGILTLSNSVVAGNTAVTSPDLENGTYSGATNQVGGSVQLAPLGFHGGPTPTMPPLPGSVLIDAGNNTVAGGFASDQRGLPRIVGTFADLGAVEFQDASPVVVTNADSGVGSLRYAATYTTNGAHITFATNLSGATITVASSLFLSKDVTIDGSTLSPGVTLSGGNSHTIIFATAGNVLLDSLALVNAAGGEGGAILNSANLTVNRCTLYQNTAVIGGGIYNSAGTVTANQSTFTGNTANAGSGGAIYSFGGGSITINQCTLYQNAAESGTGGGIWSDGSVFLDNSIIAGNTAPGGGADISAPTISFTGPNIANQINGSISGTLPFNVAPNLYILGNYGGPTPTMPPLPGSQAIDIATATGLTTDQRGFPRPVGAGPDLGAVEGTFNTNGVGRLPAPAHQANGPAIVSFTNFTDISFSLLASTNVALPLNLWSNLGPVTDSPPGSGHYQFTDPQATNNVKRFYRIRSP